MSAGAPSPDSIDRVSPTLRPPGFPVMTQRWAHLLFLHWEVPADRLRSLLPPGLTLDTWEGRAYAGLVPFTVTGARPSFLPPLPGLSRFHEVNARTYVHWRGRDPGVWFFSLDASLLPAVLGARATYKLPYFHARMSLEEEPPTLSYHSERRWPRPLPAGCHLRYRGVGPPQAAPPGTLEHFLMERYILYAYSKGRLYQGRVHHSPYPLQGAVVDLRHESLLAAAGILRPNAPPLCHYAREVRPGIFPLRRMPC